VTWIESHPTWQRTATKAHACNSIRCCFGWAIKMDILAHDPFKRVRYISTDRRSPATSDEFKTLIAYCRDGNFIDMMQFLWESGCRPDEMVRLKWAHVRRDLGAIVIPEHKTARKTGRPRQIPLTPALLEILDRAKQRRPDSEIVFLTQTGNPWIVSNNLSLKFRRLRARAKLRESLSLYAFRHSTATRLLASNVPDRIAAEILGHADTRMLAKYVHPTIEHTRDALQRASAFRLGATAEGGAA
jgi:integrase